LWWTDLVSFANQADDLCAATETPLFAAARPKIMSAFPLLIALVSWGSPTPPAAAVDGVGGIAELRAEVHALTTLVLAQNERLRQLEGSQTQVAPSTLRGMPAPPPLPPPTSIPKQVKPKPEPRKPKKEKKSPRKPQQQQQQRGKKHERKRRRSQAQELAAITRPTMLSPNFRLVAELSLGAGLAAAAMAPAPAGTPPRFIVVADTLGRLHAFDAVGRALMPPAPLIPEAVGAVRVLSMVFLGAGAPSSGRSSAAVPVLLAAAIAHDEGSAEEHGGFTFCLYRIAPLAQPTPDQRIAVDLVRESNVTWPLPPASESAEEGSSPSTSRLVASSGAPQEAHPHLVALETMASSPALGGGKGTPTAPTFLVVRSDGMLVTLSSAGAVLAGVASGIGGVHMSRRSGTTLALLSHERLVLLELARRAPPRDCPIPESLLSSGIRLTSVAFDEHIPQLLYVSTSSGSTLLYNSRSRAAPAPPGAAAEAGDSKAVRPSVECRWLDTLAVEPGAETEASHALSALKGYLIAVGAQALSARNISSIYHSALDNPHPTSLVHFEVIGRGDVDPLDAGALPRLMLGSGNTFLVEGGELDLAQDIESGASLRIYSSALPYEPPVPPSWPKYVMGIAVVGITGIYQLYKRRGSSSSNKGKGGDGGRGRPGGNFGRRGGGIDDDDDPFSARYAGGRGRPGQGSIPAGAEAHYAAHMGAAYGRGAGMNRGGGYDDDSD
jgi:hypothetical protein